MKNCLEKLRQAKGLSQADLGMALEVSRQTIISLEKGRYNPSLTLAYRISRYFDRPIEDIFFDTEEES